MRLFRIAIFSLVLLLSSCAVMRRGAPRGAFIVISKQDMTLTLCDFRSHVLLECEVACGARYGDKRISGDMKTPEGRFSVSEIVDASLWTHDFGDGKGEIEGAYGPYFFRLATPPHTGIGIHGTHNAASIGTRASEGCIRLNNSDLVKLKEYVYLGMPVIVTSSYYDFSADKGLYDF